MEPDKEATEGEVFDRLKHDISRRLNNVCSEWSEADRADRPDQYIGRSSKLTMALPSP